MQTNSFFDLPQNWEIKTLNDVCNIYTGNSINKQKKEKNFIGLKDGLNYIGTKDISFDNKINYDNGVKIPFNDLKDFKIAKSHSSLLCIEGGSAGRKIGFTNQDICFGNKLCCFEVFEDEPKFIYYYLQSNYFLEEFNSNIQGLIGGISKEKIKRIKILIPPLEVQKEIASRLDFSFDKIDKALKLLNQNKEYIKKYRLSLLKYAFDGKLTPSSKNWEIKTFEECLQYEQPTKYIVKSTKYNDSYKTPVLTAGKSFILGYTNETDGIFTQTPVIIFDDFTTDTKFVDFHFKVKSSAMKILHPNGKADIKFLYYLMQTIQHRSDTHKRYWISEYSKIKIPIPPIEVQKEIVSILDNEFEVMEKVEKLNNENIENLLLLKKSLLKEAFSGNLLSF